MAEPEYVWLVEAQKGGQTHKFYVGCKTSQNAELAVKHHEHGCTVGSVTKVRNDAAVRFGELRTA